MNYLEIAGQCEAAKTACQAEAHAAQVALPALLSGESTWLALKCAIEGLSRIAPEDHDVVIQVGDISVLEARFVEPHTLFFKGVNQDGHGTWIVTHFSQLHARIVYYPKRGQSRTITGFGPDALDQTG